MADTAAPELRARATVASILVDTIDSLDLQWPTVSEADREANAKLRAELEAESE